MVRIARSRLRTDGYLSGRDFADLVKRFGEEPLSLDLRKRLRLIPSVTESTRPGNRRRPLFEEAILELARRYHKTSLPKEFIVHWPDLFPPKTYTDAYIAGLFGDRRKVTDAVRLAAPSIPQDHIDKARHFYLIA
jgi:hypothetical protein